ncbi:tRNA 4-thiouridine(8) synthase ThiI [candidate division WOR-3 bacterium]|nr:tRNA 4-thiouridine(8) synthase ThiI [candidate division WOR-3 bacterium]
MKVLVLFSGGLDSLLASFWVKSSGLEPEHIFIKTPFNRSERPQYFAEKYGLKLNLIETDRNYLEIIKNPEYGTGKNLNPCIDCHAFMIKQTGILLEHKKAAFIVTGEVLGQRPMSQRKDGLRSVDRLSGYGELTVRPLSGKLLEKTTPEKLGWIKREKMLSISGRGRAEQLELAKQYGIDEYENPAGGCLLTDKNISSRTLKLIQRNEFDKFNIELVRVGRHFVSRSGTKIILGRNKNENDKLFKMKRKNDLFLEQNKIKAPSALILFPFKSDDLQTAADLICFFSKNRNGNFTIPAPVGEILSRQLSDEEVERMKLFK